jgi:hypothetical protein
MSLFGIGYANKHSGPDTRQSKEDAKMGSTSFDIFKVTSDGPLWIEVVDSLEEATERMAHIALISPGEYFIHSQEEGIVAKPSQEFLGGLA